MKVYTHEDGDGNNRNIFTQSASSLIPNREIEEEKKEDPTMQEEREEQMIDRPNRHQTANGSVGF